MARSFLLFHACWNHSFSRWKFQTLFSPFKSMVDNAIFKFCEQKNLFLSSIYWRITLLFLQGFSWLLINCLTSSLRLKIVLFTLKISLLLFFHNLLFLNMLINLAEKESPPHILLNILYKYDRSIWISNELPILPFERNKRPLLLNKQKHDSIFLNSSSSSNSRWLAFNSNSNFALRNSSIVT